MYIFLKYQSFGDTVCPGSSDPFYIKRVTILPGHTVHLPENYWFRYSGELRGCCFLKLGDEAQGLRWYKAKIEASTS